MTVRELMERLAAHPPDAEVLASCPFDHGHDGTMGRADTLATKAGGR